MANKYIKEFKEDALRIVEREGVRQASEKLGLREEETRKRKYRTQKTKGKRDNRRRLQKVRTGERGIK